MNQLEVIEMEELAIMVMEARRGTKLPTIRIHEPREPTPEERAQRVARRALHPQESPNPKVKFWL